MEPEELKKAITGLSTAMRSTAVEAMTLTYRVDLLEQVTLRLLAELADRKPSVSAAIGDLVRRRAEESMQRRQGELELRPQQSMLELLNNVLVAAGLQPGARSGGG